MIAKINFLVSLLSFVSVSQFCIPIPKAIAQTSKTGMENFMLRREMKIESQFKYSEIRVTQQQKEEWSDSLFEEGSSLSMRLENIEALGLSEDDLQNNNFDNGIEVIRF